jgi:hypothetical protein
MSREGAFLVEDFLAAIASQLDRTQDALALKAVNRPLTYAIRDFTMELKVFVDMDAGGHVRLRSPAPNEVGASTINIGFTTITRPMIEENTVSVEMTRSPDLSQAGLTPEERGRLERLGVRNTAQLERLKASTGTGAISRLADISVDRLRGALSLGRPAVSGVSVAPAPAAPPRPAPPAAVPPKPPVPPAPAPAPVITVPPGGRRLELTGRNMLGPAGPPAIRLAGRPLAVHDADEHRVVVELPEQASGTLEVDLADGEVQTFQVEPLADASLDRWSVA